MSDPIDTPIQDYTYIGEGTQVQGSLTFKGDTKVAGKVKGEVRVHGEVPFSVEPTGVVQGTIYCHHIDIYGEVNGDIHSQGTVTLYPSSKLDGQLEAADLVIHPGAIVNFEGKTEAIQPTDSSQV
jgi:cytoskeletal protein CcmA (bactofilin family)